MAVNPESNYIEISDKLHQAIEADENVSEDQLIEFINCVTNVSVLKEYEPFPFFFALLRMAGQAGYDSAYDYFIHLLKTQTFPENVKKESHHIVPQHRGGSGESSNLIKIPVPLHVLAHWILWRENSSENDRRAFLMRCSISGDYQALKMRLLQESYKNRNMLFYNPQLQRELGKRGGRKGGTANTPKQFEARQKVGKAYGYQVGVGNQLPDLIAFLENYAVWHFFGYQDESGIFRSYGRSRPKFPDVEFYVVTSPTKAFSDVAKILNEFFPSQHDLDVLRELIPREKPTSPVRKNRYGWSLYKTLTRSEVEAGALNDIPGYLYFVDDTYQYYKDLTD